MSLPITSARRCVPGADKLRSYRQRVKESRAGPGKIETPRVRSAEAILHQTRRSGKQHVGSHGRDDDQIDIDGRRLGLFEEFLGCRGRQVRRRHTLLRDVSFTDAGPVANPLVAGVDHLLQVGVREHARRHVTGHS